MTAQETAHNTLIDLDADVSAICRAMPGTAPIGITAFHDNDGVNELSLGPLRARPTPTFRRKQRAVLSLSAHCGDAAECDPKPKNWTKGK